MSKNEIIRHALIVFLLLPLITFAEAKETKEHKVITGDTLWDITKAELNDPFLWPKVWRENPWLVNPHLIYPDQMIKIPLYLIDQDKSEEEVRLKPTLESQGSEVVADKSHQGIKEEEVRPKPASESQGSEVVAYQCCKGIKGIVLMNGEKIEGQIISMNADRVVIRTEDGKVSCYNFIEEVQNFIKK